MSATRPTRHYCLITASRTEPTLDGGERWVLTHVCGKEERRIRRLPGKPRIHRAPKKVACMPKPKEES